MDSSRYSNPRSMIAWLVLSLHPATELLWLGVIYLADRFPSSINSSLGVTPKAMCYPSRSKPRWRRKHLFPRRKKTPGFLHSSEPSANRRWPEIPLGSRDFYFKGAPGLVDSSLTLPLVGGIRWDFRTEKGVIYV